MYARVVQINGRPSFDLSAVARARQQQRHGTMETMLQDS